MVGVALTKMVGVALTKMTSALGKIGKLQREQTLNEAAAGVSSESASGQLTWSPPFCSATDMARRCNQPASNQWAMDLNEKSEAENTQLDP